MELLELYSLDILNKQSKKRLGDWVFYKYFNNILKKE